MRLARLAVASPSAGGASSSKYSPGGVVGCAWAYEFLHGLCASRRTEGEQPCLSDAIHCVRPRPSPAFKPFKCAIATSLAATGLAGTAT
jgi:hypothetical protein